jgi:predicted DNA-binding protein (MmcQ/YjbR family)
VAVSFNTAPGRGWNTGRQGAIVRSAALAEETAPPACWERVNTMSPEEIAALLLGLPEVTEEEPFEPGVPVYKVAGKVFAIYQPGSSARITLKCDPAWALHLRAEYAGIAPGYHVNKRLWNTVSLDGSIPDDVLTDLVRHSYEQVAAGLSKTDRERVLAQFN